MRESFIFYKSFYEAIKDLPRDVQGEIYTAIMEYSLYGKETEQLKPIARSIFTLIKPQIDKNNSRYENGKKGGRPPSEQKPNNNQSETKQEPNVNDNVNVNDNNSSTDVLLSKTYQPHVDNINYTELVNWFNKTTNGVFGVLRIPLSEKRKGMIRSRIREHGKDVFCEAIKIAYKSDFLKGSGGRDFKASFDWIIKPTNFEKIISGNYDNKNIGNNKNSGITDDLARNIAEGIARANYEKQQ